ncbi:MAG TPA: hypothetical protein VG322_10650 [Candidatus Acidoferrales bacterium]|nr:hypothetical protein [Candidatus Acidoferrales bacterium]
MTDRYHIPGRLHGHRGRFRYFLVALTLLGLLFMTATLGGVLHHHQDSTTEKRAPYAI